MADYTPTLGDFTELKPFRFWCQKVLPLVYDDSLSYYELLCKVVDYLNKTMEDVDTMHDDVVNLHSAYVQLQTYVNTYFDNLDVQEEINNKLDEMAENGSLSLLLAPFIPDLVAAWLAEHITPTTPAIDNTLTVSGAGADAKVTGSNIDYTNKELANILNKNNLLVDPDSMIFNHYYDTQAQSSANFNYYVVSLTAGTQYTMRGVRFISDGSEVVLNWASPEYIATYTPETTGTYYVSVSKLVDITFLTTTTNYNSEMYGTLEQPALSPNIIKQSSGTSKTATMSQKAITDTIAEITITNHVNLADPDGFTLNRYLGPDGSVGSSDNYFFTDLIDVRNNKVLSFSEVRFVTAYDSDLTVLPAKGANFENVDGTLYVADSSVYYVRITGKTANKDSFMVNYGEYQKNFVPYSVVNIKDNIIANQNATIGYSTTGAIRRSNKAASLNSGVGIYVNDFPKNTKNGVTLTSYCEFESFSGFAIGKGYDSYRGDWFYINSVVVMHYHYEDSRTLVNSANHNLTISDYLAVCIDIKADGKAYITLNTASGTSQLEFQLTHEQNGTPFAYGSQSITNVILTATATKANCPIWILGDSYLGYSTDRVMGQLEDLGYGNNLLIDGLAGRGSVEAWIELVALLKNNNTPRILVWYLGMNDTDNNYEIYLSRVVNLCKDYGITLVINDTPTTTEVDNESKHTLVSYYKTAGYRIVNSYEIVGSSSSGTWRTGYLSSDGVHPSINGAKALALALLTSVPEITEFE